MIRACCPDCRLGLFLRERDEDGNVARERKVWREDDAATVQLFVRSDVYSSGRERIAGDSGFGDGAPGAVECPHCGFREVDALRAVYERRLHARGD